MFRSIDLFNLGFRSFVMSYVKACLFSEFCDQCGIELLDNESAHCSEHCQELGKHDRDDWQDEMCEYKVEPNKK